MKKRASVGEGVKLEVEVEATGVIVATSSSIIVSGSLSESESSEPESRGFRLRDIVEKGSSAKIQASLYPAKWQSI